MSPYLVLGMIGAGFFHVLVPVRFVAKHLGGGGLLSVVKSVFLGIPLPLCSCSVIPAAVMIRKMGASRGAVLSFLIATPITGIDSIFATYALMGSAVTWLRLGSSTLVALIAGFLVAVLLGSRKGSPNIPENGSAPTCSKLEKNSTASTTVLEKFRKTFYHGLRYG